MPIIKTEGLIAAPFTPMHADRSVNLNAIEPYAHWLQKNGVVGAFVCGTTGEAMSLTLQERQQVAQRWVDVAPKTLRVIVHVGHTTLADCRTLAAHAEQIGADSISCLAPFFFKPYGVAGLVDWCEQVAAAAPKTPFYYYHIPSMTGVSLKVHEFLHGAAARIPNLAGIKYTFEDVDDCQRCVEMSDGRYDILFGRDEMLLTALQFGSRGAVGSTYNFAAPIYRKLIAAYDQGDLAKAQEYQAIAVQMIDLLIQGGPYPTATFKWFMSREAIDCGPARLPLVNPTTEQIAALEKKLAAIPLLSLLK
jgi:N-acetylneuraminate lyase